MANQYDDFDFDEDDAVETDSSAPANLRKALRKAERERKDLEKQLNEIRAAQREQSVKSVLESKGVSPKLAKLIPSDVTSADQVEAWLSEWSDVFSPAAPQQTEPQEVDPRAEQMARLHAAVNGAQPASANAEDQLKALQNVTSKAELDALTGNAPSRFQR